MKNTKAILITAIVSFLVWLIAWFTAILPPAKFKSYRDQAPDFIDYNIVDVYPDDLIVDIKNGQIDINQPSPYCLVTHYSSDTKKPIGIVYDSSAVADPAVFSQDNKYSDPCTPFALVGKNFFIYPDGSKSNQYKVNTLPDTVNYQLTKDIINDFIDKTLPKVMEFASHIYYFIPFVLFLFTFPFILLFNSWYAFVLKLALKLFKVDPSLTKGKIYGTSLLIYFLILFTQTVTKGHFISFPFSNSIIICLFAVLYFKSRSPVPLDNDQTPSAPVK